MTLVRFYETEKRVDYIDNNAVMSARIDLDQMQVSVTLINGVTCKAPLSKELLGSLPHLPISQALRESLDAKLGKDKVDGTGVDKARSGAPAHPEYGERVGGGAPIPAGTPTALGPTGTPAADALVSPTLTGGDGKPGDGASHEPASAPAIPPAPDAGPAPRRRH